MNKRLPSLFTDRQGRERKN